MKSFGSYMCGGDVRLIRDRRLTELLRMGWARFDRKMMRRLSP